MMRSQPPQPLDSLNIFKKNGIYAVLWWSIALYRDYELFNNYVKKLIIQKRIMTSLRITVSLALITAILLFVAILINILFNDNYMNFNSMEKLYYLVVGSTSLTKQDYIFVVMLSISSFLLIVFLFGRIVFIPLWFSFLLSFIFCIFISFFFDPMLSMGLSTGVFFGIASGKRTGIFGGIYSGIIFFVTTGLVSNSLSYGYQNNIALIQSSIALSVSFLIVCTRIYYYIPHMLWIWPLPKGQFYNFHPIYWDSSCSLPFRHFNILLLDYHRHDPEGAAAEIDRLIATYPSQRHAALKAKTALLIRAAAEQPLVRLGDTLADLPEGDKDFLTQTAQVKREAAVIAQTRRDIDAHNRKLFRSLHATQLVNRILAFQGTVSGFHEPLASELRAASSHWLAEAEALQREAEQAAQGTDAVRQLFRAGDPVDREREAFVTRPDVLAELERQVLLAGGCPGLLLYGRRRVGKTTILKGLEGLIPATVLPVTVSLQNPLAGGDLGHFCGHLRQRIAQRLGWAEDLPDTATLPDLMRTLARADGALADQALAGGADGRRLLLALDEYETLDLRIMAGAFPHDVLGAVRESIQTHRRITWLFAGSHHIDELEHPDWASHLISVRMVPVRMFTGDETQRLLTDPLAHSSLFRGRDDPRRPHIKPEFWGADGIGWLHATAGGWPHLVQLLAEAAVDEVNDRQAAVFDNGWRGDLLDRAAQRGEMVLRQLLLRESVIPGEEEYVRGFAVTPDQPPPADPAVARSLHRRELVVVENGGWRLRVPLMQHWLIRNRDVL